jgi:hypothetical protein
VRPVVYVLVAVAVLAVVFAVGIALGMALHDNPKPGGTFTYVRTFVPGSKAGP